MDTKAKDVSMQLAEDARQADWEAVSFTAEVFKGSFRWDLLHPFPAQSAEDKRIGDEYIEKIRPVIEKYDRPVADRRRGRVSAARRSMRWPRSASSA